jgi:signal peptidase
MYRPLVLNAPYITHRIIAVGSNGYITKGDNSPYADQDGGEPQITSDRIVGKVLTAGGRPLILPGLGNISAAAQKLLGDSARTVAGIFFLLSILAVMIGGKKRTRSPIARHRLRLRHVYHGAGLLAAGLILLSIYLGSRVTQIQYLVSEYPGTLGDQVEVGKPGELTMTVRNTGWIPIWNVTDGIAPLTTDGKPVLIGPRSSETVRIETQAEKKTGNYQGYVRTYNYPALLPGTWIAALHVVYPHLALAAVGLAIGFWLLLAYFLLNRIPGYAGWIPLRAVRDRMAERRLQRIRAGLLGRRRVR